MNSEQVAMAFVEAINREDVEKICELMSPGYVFIDALGNRHPRTRMVQGWTLFFAAFPKYRIEIGQVFAHGSSVALFGIATGGWRVGEKILDQRWKVNAAWLAEIVDTQVAQWSVFCDTGWIKPPNPPNPPAE